MIKKLFTKRLIFIIILTCLFLFAPKKVNAYSYLSDKAEIPVALENTGARSICQTDDGYIWIGQFAGLNRYDSKELVTYNKYTYEGKEYVLENVRELVQYRNKLFMVSSIGLSMYYNYEFKKIDISDGNMLINNLEVDEDGILYVSTDKGLYLYNTETEKAEIYNQQGKKISGLKKKISTIKIDGKSYIKIEFSYIVEIKNKTDEESKRVG